MASRFFKSRDTLNVVLSPENTYQPRVRFNVFEQYKKRPASFRPPTPYYQREVVKSTWAKRVIQEAAKRKQRPPYRTVELVKEVVNPADVVIDTEEHEIILPQTRQERLPTPPPPPPPPQKLPQPKQQQQKPRPTQKPKERPPPSASTVVRIAPVVCELRGYCITFVDLTCGNQFSFAIDKDSHRHFVECYDIFNKYNETSLIFDLLTNGQVQTASNSEKISDFQTLTKARIIVDYDTEFSRASNSEPNDTLRFVGSRPLFSHEESGITIDEANTEYENFVYEYRSNSI